MNIKHSANPTKSTLQIENILNINSQPIVQRVIAWKIKLSCSNKVSYKLVLYIF